MVDCYIINDKVKIIIKNLINKSSEIKLFKAHSPY